MEAPKDHRPCIVLRGSTTKKSAYSLVNRMWVAGLRKRGYRVITDADSAGVGRTATVVIHHDFEDRFGEIKPPEHGKFVAVRTWDFGPYPPAWVDIINAQCDQLWVYSRWVCEQAVNSGIAADRVRVIPLAFDHAVFRREGPRYRLPSPKRFVFLFVGAAVKRKGIDILLDAYTRAFSRDDDVALVIKDHSGDVFYSNISYKDQIHRVSRDRDAPEIIYINAYLEAADLASLYRRCDVAVFPYRAEGFASPILEALATGTPPIVPNFGACRDYCTPSNAFMLPVKRIALPVNRRFAFNTLGFEEDLDGVDFCETPVDTLVDFLVDAYNANAVDLAKKAATAADSVRKEYTWQRAIDRVIECLDELDNGMVPVRFR